jgi:4-hydroxy-tetrahydrodipicolinate reductase
MSAQPLPVAVGGASGRMGRAVCAAILDAPDLRLVGGCGAPNGGQTGEDLGLLAGRARADIPLCDHAGLASSAACVWIDVSTPAGLCDNLANLAPGVVGAVIGVTGLTPSSEAALTACAARRALVYSGNFSLGLNVLLGLVREAAARLDPQWDIEILDIHHRHKRDAPSGTALMLGEAAAQGRGQELAALRIGPHACDASARPQGAIGFAALRGGSLIGEHQVLFAGEHESLMLSHSAQSREIFAAGALLAARWASGRPAGRYCLQDVLGFTK